jgi:hypothetical protein
MSRFLARILKRRAWGMGHGAMGNGHGAMGNGQWAWGMGHELWLMDEWVMDVLDGAT